ncbi:MAG: DNA polymerase III subunit delta [Bacteroidales bacterium]|nr:DNA polymerase III subunit delta [Bacteroidales bacterium]
MASLPAPTFEGIKKALAAKDYAPVYILHGEEGYYIDELVKEFEKILPDQEKDFNQYILFAPEVEPTMVAELCMRVPMMAEHQVVILKECQVPGPKKLARLAAYVAAPNPSTIFVMCFRGKKLESKEFKDAIKKGKGIIFESPKIQPYNAPAFVEKYIRSKGLSADQKSVAMLVDFVGSDLSRLYNEIDKLSQLLPPNASITPEVIEQNIGISRDYNSWELTDALCDRDGKKVFRILNYMRANPKAMPLVLIIGSVFNFFSDLLIAYYSPNRSNAGISAELGLKNSYALDRIRKGMAAYNPYQLVEIISAIRDFDVKSKGVDSRQNEFMLFHDLMFHILTARGQI